MPSAQERAKKLAQEMRKAVKEAKEAELRAKRLGEEVVQALAEAKAEIDNATESSETVAEYPPGRYECKACRNPLIFMEPTRQLTPCENCGGTEFTGHEPRIVKIVPPAPKKYPPGMYECAGCGARIALAEGVDDLTPCDICGIAVLRAPRP